MDHHIVIEKDQQVLHCSKCRVPLQMTEYRGLYCPKCESHDLKHPPESILCCTECDNPLRVIDHKKGFGSYCIYCDFHPSTQDTYLINVSAIKRPT